MSELKIRMKNIPKTFVKMRQDESVLKSEENWMGLNYISDESDASSTSEYESFSPINNWQESLSLYDQISGNVEERSMDISSENVTPEIKEPIEKYFD